MIQNCVVCGEPFESIRKSHVCCSRKCRDKYTKMKKPKICLTCGKEFFTDDISLYCSKECKHERKNNQRVFKKCERCGKIFLGFSYSKYCSIKCKSEVSREVHRTTAICENCGKEYEKNEYIEVSYQKAGKEYHSFCSHSCCISYLYKTRKITARFSQAHQKVNEFLDALGIGFKNEQPEDNYCLDIKINDNKAIEVMGSYWHGDIRRYPDLKNMEQRQFSCIEKDKRKQKVVEADGIKILYLWEIDIKKNPELCIALIKEFMNNTLENFHSSSYILEEGNLKKIDLKQYMEQ